MEINTRSASNSAIGKTENGTVIPKIEWSAVNLLLDNERKKSLDYIDRILR